MRMMPSGIKSIAQRHMLEGTFAVSWILGRYCNYNCSYCWPYARSNKKDHRSLDLILLTIDEIKRQAKDNGFNKFHFSFSGGEPTFHPNYLEIVEYLLDDSPWKSIHMTSNCSRKIDWFKDYAKLVSQFDKSSITASYHKEHVNSPQKIQEFGDKLLLCLDHGVRTTINMVMVPERFDDLLEEAKRFSDRGINVTLKPQSDELASRIVGGYTEEQLEILRNDLPQKDLDGSDRHQIIATDVDGKEHYIDQAERLNALGLNEFEGWECNAGYQSIIIREPDGSIKRSYSCRDEPLGYINKGFKLFDKPMPCITPRCVSSADSKIPKRKICF